MAGAEGRRLESQLKLQDEAARLLRAERHRLGALACDRIEAKPIIVDEYALLRPSDPPKVTSPNRRFAGLVTQPSSRLIPTASLARL